MKDQAPKKKELDKLRQQKIARLQRQIALQKEIGELNARLAAIVESSADAIIGKDLDGIITSWNRGAEKIYGYAAEEAIGRPISIIVPSSHADETQSILKKIRKGERLDNYETVRLTKDGALLDVSLTISPIRNASGTITGSSTIGRDITRRKKYEETVKRQARILNQIQDAVITTDLDGRVTSWNRGAEKIYLYTAAEVLGRHISFIYPDSQRQFLEHGVIAPLKEKGEHECEVLLRRKSGEEFYALLLLSMLKNDSGYVVGMVGSSRDITVRKKAEEKIRRDKEEWEQTFDAMPDFVAVIDSEHVIRRANRALAAKLGIDRDELIGKLCYEVMCGLEKPLDNCPGRMSISTGKEQIEERYVEKLHGHFLISCTPISLCDGDISCTVEVCRDISERKMMERMLEEAAITDILSGLLNRRGFIVLAEHQLHIANRDKKNRMLIYVDLDGMKKINDDFGHKEGDRALADAAHILKKSFRESDVLGRIGGDEFAILLTEPSERGLEQIIRGHVQENLMVHNEHGGRPYRLALSLGVAHYDPSHPCTLDELMAVADQLMYSEKRKNKPEK